MRSIELPANGRIYKLSFSINALCSLELAAGKSFGELIADLQNPRTLSVRLFRLALWAALQDSQPGTNEMEAGAIMTAAGGVLPAMEKVAQALALVTPEDLQQFAARAG